MSGTGVSVPVGAAAGTSYRGRMRTARVVARTSAVLFADPGDGLVAVHGPDVEPFPFSLVIAARDVPALPAEGSVRLGEGVVVLPGGRRVAARAVPAAVPGPPGVRPGPMRDAIDAVPGAAERAAAIGPLDDPDRLLGRGPGLTPAGDDALLGYIAMAAHAHRDWDLPDPAPLARALAERAPARTTRVSAAMFAAAAEGRFAPAVGAVCRAGPDALPAALARLAAVGATSGLDTLVGVGAACGLSPLQARAPASPG